jgi:hypothetical protein
MELNRHCRSAGPIDFTGERLTMLLTSIKQFRVRFRSGDQAARRCPVQSIVVVSAALILFMGSMGQARADFITFTGQPTFQTTESASITPMTSEGFPEPTQQQTYTNPAIGATSNTFALYTLTGSAAASVDTGYNSSPVSLTDYVLLSSSAASNAGPEGGLYQFQSAAVESSASLQGATFTLNQPASAVLTFDPTLTLGSLLGWGGGVTEEFGSATVALQGNDGSSIQITAQEVGINGVLHSSTITAETVTPGPSSIQTVYGGADSVEMNLAPGTYAISGSAGVSSVYGIDADGSFSASVNGGAELVLNAIGGPPAPTPEPATFTLLSSGVFGFGGWRLWRKRRVV